MNFGSERNAEVAIQHSVLRSVNTFFNKRSKIFRSTQDDKEKAIAMRAHLDSVRSHIKLLSDKKYESADKLTTPEFVLLFMPIEPALIAAFNEDNNLFSFAWERNIILVSPTTLLATLRTVASIWAQEKRSKNSENIAKEAGTFIDKLEGFVGSLETLERNLSTAQNTLSAAMGQLKTGKGNLLGKAKNMKIMGAKSGSNACSDRISRWTNYTRLSSDL